MRSADIEILKAFIGPAIASILSIAVFLFEQKSQSLSLEHEVRRQMSENFSTSGGSNYVLDVQNVGIQEVDSLNISVTFKNNRIRQIISTNLSSSLKVDSSSNSFSGILRLLNPGEKLLVQFKTSNIDPNETPITSIRAKGVTSKEKSSLVFIGSRTSIYAYVLVVILILSLSYIQFQKAKKKIKLNRNNNLIDTVGYLLKGIKHTYFSQFDDRDFEVRLNVMAPDPSKKDTIGIFFYDNKNLYNENEFKDRYRQHEGKSGKAWAIGRQQIYAPELPDDEVQYVSMEAKSSSVRDLRSILSTPILINDKVVGILNIDSNYPAHVTHFHNSTVQTILKNAANEIASFISLALQESSPVYN